MEELYEVLTPILPIMETDCRVHELVEKAKEVFYVYVLEGERDYFYCGQSANIYERYMQHNRGESKSTASNKPYVLKWLVECDSRKKARFIEVYIKSMGVKKFLQRERYTSRSVGNSWRVESFYQSLRAYR